MRDIDSNLEREVQRLIEVMVQDYGIVTIAHRLSTVLNANRIFTIEDARIVEQGTHVEMIGEAGSLPSCTRSSRGG